MVFGMSSLAHIQPVLLFLMMKLLFILFCRLGLLGLALYVTNLHDVAATSIVIFIFFTIVCKSLT